MKIYLASDHGGFQLKELIKNHLLDNGHEVEDMGNDHYDSGDDYTQFVIPLAEEVIRQRVDNGQVLGIIFGRSGNGEAIAANKVKGIRAAVCINEELAKTAREHNDANILSIGADYVDFSMAKNMADIFINTPFSFEERHRRRVKMIVKYENNKTL